MATKAGYLGLEPTIIVGSRDPGDLSLVGSTLGLRS